MPSNSYDLSSSRELAALVCATLCAPRPAEPWSSATIAARYTLAPQAADRSGDVADDRGSASERCSASSRRLALRRKLREPKIAAQLVAPDLRIDLGADAWRRARARGRQGGRAGWLAGWERGSELARLLDSDARQRARLPRRRLLRAPRDGKLASGARRRDVGTSPGRSPTRCCGATRAIGCATLPVACAIARAVDAWAPARRPCARWRCDARAVRRKLTTAGGEVRAGRVTEIGVSWGKIGVHAREGDELGPAGRREPSPRARRAPRKKAPKRLTELADGVALVGYRYTLKS